MLILAVIWSIDWIILHFSLLIIVFKVMYFILLKQNMDAIL